MRSSAIRSRPTPTSRCSRCLRAGAPASTSSPAASSRACSRPAAIPRKILFSGVGQDRRTRSGSRSRAGIGCLNVESEAELERIDRVARSLGRRAPVAFRVNPDIDAKTHPYISTGLRENKFGVAHGDAERLYRHAATLAGIELVGIGCHIGSQLTGSAPFAEAARRIAELADRLQAAGIALRHIDIGGGIGIRYQDEAPEPVGRFLEAALRALAGRKETVIVRSRPLDRRQRRRPAHARGVREAG